MPDCGELLLLDDVRGRLRPTGESYVGLQPIEVARIVGTVDRCCDFDRCFHPRRADLRARVAVVERAFAGRPFPPIDVVQVAGAYFVSDGHKRVAAARRAGVEQIDADVRRVAVAYPVDEHTTASDLELLDAEDRFARASGLRAARPGVRVRCLSQRSYAELLEAVKAHGHDLMRAEGRLVEPAAVAAHWHDCDYRPSLAAARDVGLAGLLDCCPEAELYLVVHRLALGAPGADCEALHGAARDAASNADVPVSRARRRARRARRA